MRINEKKNNVELSYFPTPLQITHKGALKQQNSFGRPI